MGAVTALHTFVAVGALEAITRLGREHAPLTPNACVGLVRTLVGRAPFGAQFG